MYGATDCKDLMARQSAAPCRGSIHTFGSSALHSTKIYLKRTCYNMFGSMARKFKRTMILKLVDRASAMNLYWDARIREITGESNILGNDPRTFFSALFNIWGANKVEASIWNKQKQLVQSVVPKEMSSQFISDSGPYNQHIRFTHSGPFGPHLHH